MHSIRFSLCLALFACGSVTHGGNGDGSPDDADGAPPGFQTLAVTVTGDGAITSDPAGIDCPETCSVEVLGLGEAVSYLYSGGLDIKDLVL